MKILRRQMLNKLVDRLNHPIQIANDTDIEMYFIQDRQEYYSLLTKAQNK